MPESKRPPGEAAAGGNRDRLPGRSEDSPSTDGDQVIANISKNSRELLRVQVRIGRRMIKLQICSLIRSTFKGHNFADLRIHYRDGDELKPSGKGITAKTEQLDQLIAALQEAKAALGGVD